MKYRSLGNCGMKVSMFGLGSWITYGSQINDEKTVKSIINTAYESGINLYDCSDAYGKGDAEIMLGKVLKDLPRSNLVITTKLFWPMSDDANDRGLSRKHIFESIDKSLKHLQTDYVDIYFCHRFDTETPLEETARAMDDLVHQGKVLYWGTSVWNDKQLRDINALCREKNLYRPQVEQPQYSLIARKLVEEQVRPATTENGMGLVTWSPLASGILTGKYDDGIPDGTRLAYYKWIQAKFHIDKIRDNVKKFKAHADGLGCTRSQLALAWAASQPGISSVLLGATTLDQLNENLGALAVDVTEEINTKLKQLFPIGIIPLEY